jgi:hypothetical protein
MLRPLILTMLLIACSHAWALAQPGIPPLVPAPIAPAPSPPATQLAPPEDPVVVGNMEHLGWSLSGPRARHYIFGGLAVADYVSQGKRRIVTLQEHSDLLKPDPDYLYYRELRDGNWWAFRKHPWPDRTYSVWFRAADAPPNSKWQRFQAARLQMTGN